MKTAQMLRLALFAAGPISLAPSAHASTCNLYYVDGQQTLTQALAICAGSDKNSAIALIDNNGNPISASNGLSVLLEPGTNIAGKFGVDQTTPGVTNNVTLSDASGHAALVSQSGDLSVAPVPTKVFYDGFDTGTFDQTNNWAAPVSAGGGVSVSVGVGSATLLTGTTANGYSYIQSAATFAPVSPGWLALKFQITVPASPPANTYGYWGFGTTPGTPSVATPITDGCGFEIEATGKLYTVCYAGGTRNQITDLSASTGTDQQPADGAEHAYGVVYRPESFWFSIDGTVVSTQSHGVIGPNNKTLPIKIETVAGSPAPNSSLSVSISSVTLGDVGRNAGMIADGTYPFRRATVTSGGALAVAAAPTNSSGAFSSGAVGTSAATLVAANTAKVFLQIVNASSTATVWINIGGTAAVNGAGSLPLLPGGGAWTSNAAFVPSDAVSAISTAASTPVTIGAK